MKALVRRHVLPGLDRGPFKLVCHDFQPTNMIVNNEQELKVIAVTDWEE
jgi:aminoglycoside phosphotransferase (APT) family kinase protein